MKIWLQDIDEFSFKKQKRWWQKLKIKNRKNDIKWKDGWESDYEYKAGTKYCVQIDEIWLQIVITKERDIVAVDVMSDDRNDIKLITN